MAINFNLHQPGDSFGQGFAIANRMLNLAAEKQAGKALAKGDRKGASSALSSAGFIEQADQVTQRGLNQEQVAASTAASQASTAATTQQTGQEADAEKLQFTMRTAQTLKETMDRDGPQAALPAFEMMAPLIRSRGVTDEQIEQIKGGLAKDPYALINGLMATTDEKLKVLSLGAKAVDSTGRVIAENPMQYNPNVQVAPNNRVINTQTGATVATGNAPVAANPQETWKLMTPSEAKAAGFRPGVMVKVSSLGNTETVDEPPASSRSAGGDGDMPKFTPQTENQLAKLRESNQKARGLSNAADEFMRLNRKYKDTGGALSMPFAKEMVGAFDTDIGRMNMIAETEIPRMRVEGSGTTSDRDASRFERAFLSTANKYDVNQLAASAFKAYADRISDYNEYMEEYTIRKGSLIGAQGAWDRYVADPKNDVLNDQGRAKIPDKTWREYLNWNKQGGTGGPAAAGSYTWTPDGGLRPE